MHQLQEFDIFVFFVQFQQAEVIREQTGYQVGHYCGEMGQDFWDARRWQREFETKHVHTFHCLIYIFFIGKMKSMLLASEKRRSKLFVMHRTSTNPRTNLPRFTGNSANLQS